MNYRKLGKTNLYLSEVGLGAWQLSGDNWGWKPEHHYLDVIYSAIDNGVNFIDTALEYGKGCSEHIIGKALKNIGTDKEIFISTKVPPKCEKWSPPIYDTIADYFPSDWIVKCCEESLKNLDRDHVDILLLHTWNSSWFNQLEWYETFLKLKEQGKIRAFGISVSDMRSGEANVQIALCMLDVVMAVFNIFEQDPLYNLLPLVEKHTIGMIARCPFSSGALTGNWSKEITFSDDDWRVKWTDAQWLQEQIIMSTKVSKILEGHDIQMAHLALQFVLKSKAVTSVISGTSNPIHAVDNTTVSKAPQLPDDLYKSLINLWKTGDLHAVYNGG